LLALIRSFASFFLAFAFASLLMFLLIPVCVLCSGNVLQLAFSKVRYVIQVSSKSASVVADAASSAAAVAVKSFEYEMVLSDAPTWVRSRIQIRAIHERG
jgi:hypothetical protein